MEMGTLSNLPSMDNVSAFAGGDASARSGVPRDQLAVSAAESLSLASVASARTPALGGCGPTLTTMTLAGDVRIKERARRGLSGGIDGGLPRGGSVEAFLSLVASGDIPPLEGAQ